MWLRMIACLCLRPPNKHSQGVCFGKGPHGELQTRQGKERKLPLTIKNENKRGNSYHGEDAEVWQAKHHVNVEEGRL